MTNQPTNQPINKPAGSAEKTGGGRIMTLTGYAAIEYAEEHDLLLRKYTDPIEDAREDLTVDEARAVAREDVRLIYLTIE